MGEFAEHLVERDVVSPEQLERALEAQRLYGGRLGSNLVETGALDVVELTGRLSEFLGVPPPPASWLAERSPEAEQAVPSTLVLRHKVVPLRVEKRTLHVAALDPRDAGLREALEQATELQLELWVLPELRIYSLLGKRYGIRRERNVSLASLAEQARKLREARAPTPTPEPDPEEEQRRALGIAPLEEGEELVGKTVFNDLHAKHLPGNEESWLAAGLPPLDDSLFEPIESPRAPAGDGSIEADPPGNVHPVPVAAHASSGSVHPVTLEQAIASAPDRDTLIDAILTLACAHAESSAVLVLDDGWLSGRRARVAGEPRELAGIRLPCRGEGSLAGAMASGEPFHGPAAAPGDARLLDALGRSEAVELAVLPIRLGDLSVAVLCVDGGEHAIAATSFAALCELARIASRSWERLTLGLDP